MSGGYSVPSAASHALLHAVWQLALLGVIAAMVLARVPARRAAARHAVGLVGLFAMAAAPVVTFVVYRSGGVAGGGLAAAAPGGGTPLLLRPSDWIVVAVPLVWLLGASVLAARQLGGWRMVIALGRRPAPALPAGWSHRVDELRRALGISRSVALRATVGAAAPFTARTLRPIVWLPEAVWPRLSPAQQDALLAHELAHVRRLDWVWNGLQSLVEAAVFFHPAVWWLGRRVRDEREHACDDAAAAVCGDAIALAEALAALARQRAAPGLALAAGGGAVVRRIARLLDAPAQPPIGTPRWLVPVLACGLLLAAELRLPSDVLIDVRVDASSAGPLAPGGYRELTADAFGGQRHYRAAMDEVGQLHEHYEEDGQPRPIDPAVRTWLTELTSVVGWR